MARVLTYDTTLRDGSQTDGISFSCEDKLDILKKLDSAGVDFVEGGWPGSNPRDDEFFERASEVDLQNCKLVAFGSTRRYGVRPEDDENLISLSGSPASWCCIFGKTWDFHVTDALSITLDDNLTMIEDSIRFLIRSGKHVMFDAEHFFDGYKSNKDYALRTVESAEKSGAEWIVLCDTNGGTLPSDIAEIVSDVKSHINSAKLGIHCHNDSDLATACTLVAIKAGCEMFQGTVNGIGERCGNANICTVIPNIVLKMGFDPGSVKVSELTSLSNYVGELANMPPYPGMPFVGERAFTHKGGMHISALAKDPRTYEHINPSDVGNRRRILVSDMAGKTTISEKLKELGLQIGDDSPNIIRRVKDMESKGYQFDGADASFELLVKRLRGDVDKMFEVPAFRISMYENDGKRMESEASVKVRSPDGSIEHTAADGNGPVNALDHALRKALAKFYPSLMNVRLTDYKVRVLDEKSATAASVRVLIRTTDGIKSWTTVGVSENVIEASLIALTDSLEYALLQNDVSKKKVN